MLISGDSSKEAEKEAAELAAQITFKVSCHSLHDIVLCSWVNMTFNTLRAFLHPRA